MVTSLLMAKFHHAGHFRKLFKIILLTKTISVLEMTATIQINERHQNWPPQFKFTNVISMPSKMKLNSYQNLVTFNFSNYQPPLQSKFLFQTTFAEIRLQLKLHQSKLRIVTIEMVPLTTLLIIVTSKIRWSMLA